MADLKISALTASATPLAGTEVLPIVQSSTTKQVSVANLTAGRAVSAASVTTTGAVQASGNIVSASSGVIQKDVNSTFVRLIGGTVANVDPTLTMYGSTNGNAGLATYDASSHRLRAIDGTTFLNVNTDTINYGNFTQGTAGKGVNFTANTPAAGMTSQLLNWYEEGTWTPALVAGTSGTITTGSVGGKYTKVGTQVTATGYIDVASVSAPVGALTITGLPFACGSGLGSRSATSIYPSGFSATAVTSIVGRVISGETQIRVDKYSAGTVSNMAGDVVANSAFHFSVTYFV